MQLTILNEGNSRQHSSRPDECPDCKTLTERRCLEEFAPRYIPLFFDFGSDTQPDEIKFANQPFFGAIASVQAAEIVFSFLFATFEAEPSRRLRNEHDSGEKNQGGNDLDRKS